MGADVIVTYNLGDFPPATLAAYGIEAQHPNEFIAHLLDLEPGLVCAAEKRQRENLKKPPVDAQSLLAALDRQSLPQVMAVL